MHLPRLILVLLFLVALPTFTEANEGSGSLSMAEVEGYPSGLVAGCINTLTGTYSGAEVDISIPGPDPLILQRHYCSKNWKSGILCDSWTYNHAILAVIVESNSSYLFRVSKPNGGALQYYGIGGVDEYINRAKKAIVIVPGLEVSAKLRRSEEKG